MTMTCHTNNASGGSVGGAARRGTPRGPGSSPGLPTKTRKALHKKLRRLDRELHDYDNGYDSYLKWLGVIDERRVVRFKNLDAERKRTRLRLKGCDA